MIQLKVSLHNSGKQKIAKFSIGNLEENQFALDKQTIRAITQLCVATLEMAQNNMILDLSLLPHEIQPFIAETLAQKMEEALNKKGLFTANTKPKIILQPREVRSDNNNLLDTSAELCPPAV